MLIMILMIGGLICFLLGTVGALNQRLNLVSFGLALWILSEIITKYGSR